MSGNGEESEDDKLKRLQVAIVYYIYLAYTYLMLLPFLQKELEEEERKNRKLEKMNAAIKEKTKVLIITKLYIQNLKKGFKELDKKNKSLNNFLSPSGK